MQTGELYDFFIWRYGAIAKVLTFVSNCAVFLGWFCKAWAVLEKSGDGEMSQDTVELLMIVSCIVMLTRLLDTLRPGRVEQRAQGGVCCHSRVQDSRTSYGMSNFNAAGSWDTLGRLWSCTPFWTPPMTAQLISRSPRPRYVWFASGLFDSWIFMFERLAESGLLRFTCIARHAQGEA